MNANQIRWIIVVAVISTCCFLAKSSSLSTNPLKAKARILKIVPLGTELKVAAEKMEGIGFKCEDCQRQSFEAQITKEAERGKTKRYEDIDFLDCSRERSFSLLSDHRWEIALVYNKDRVVTDVLVIVWNNSFFDNGI